MTRENKLALVVGFGLILFVGILISDHFSIARQQRVADMSGRSDIHDPLDPNRGQSSFIDLNRSEPKPAAGTTLMPPSPEAQATKPPVEHPQPEQHNQINPDGLPASATGGVTQVANADSQHPDSGNGSGVTPLGSPGPEPVKNTTTTRQAAVRFHDVKPKESLFGICKQYYGDTKLLKAFAAYNKIDDPTSVKVGSRLMIPAPEEIGGKPAPATLTAKAAPSSPAAGATPSSADPASPIKVVREGTLTPAGKAKSPALVASAQTYTVKAGDSLSSIAQKCLGSKDKWRQLAAINSGVIDDEDNLQVGTKLKLQ